MIFSLISNLNPFFICCEATAKNSSVVLLSSHLVSFDQNTFLHICCAISKAYTKGSMQRLVAFFQHWLSSCQSSMKGRFVDFFNHCCNFNPL